MPRRYITTAIDYPNAPPHMGHVLCAEGKPSAVAKAMADKPVFLPRTILSLSGIAETSGPAFGTRRFAMFFV